MFFHYTQNNSGGSFQINDRVAHHVIIEANTESEANTRAEQIGIYFDGVREGEDCGCCGDRWYPRRRNDGAAEPMIYDTTPEMYRDYFAHKGEPYCHVYYMDGSKKTFEA